MPPTPPEMRNMLGIFLSQADDWVDRSPPKKLTQEMFTVVIRPEDRQLLADFVNNLTKEQRREILNKLLKSILTTKGEMEKLREQLGGDLAENAQDRIDNAA
jgi:hypothetical protein